MSIELLITTWVLIGLAAVRLGLPLLLLWLLGKVLYYMQTALP
jgi:hypothetical protein